VKFACQPLQLFTAALSEGLARSAEVELHTALIAPFVHHIGDELAAVTGLDRAWQATLHRDHIESSHDIIPLRL